ncbi:hypothetical protein AXF42_Ash011803 [Apostasia shenzhenica]|uniref:Uncharacterized protein n=1 Tax=Apostasia shenzhenica TaxID=1088818 RepID=A0A2I0AVW0_9ASPA|nr:hypothetical protein AXF42_Ash011802 [Apostasia shenzhenica]PKA59679.1 hypothetical protein AXF42_Ash011803 [Apostasia shenzhenica]
MAADKHRVITGERRNHGIVQPTAPAPPAFPLRLRRRQTLMIFCSTPGSPPRKRDPTPRVTWGRGGFSRGGQTWSFFLFFSGHVRRQRVIASFGHERNEQAKGSRGRSIPESPCRPSGCLIQQRPLHHRTSVGAGAGILFDLFSGMYHSYKIPAALDACKSGRPWLRLPCK